MSVAHTLSARQSAFMAQLLDEEAPLPQGWSERHAVGMEVYRGNYRSSLVDALQSTYERTERWVGEEAFRRAAAHHVISHPPLSWTLDDAGAGFDTTCAELFPGDPEVAELAWLEWAMFEAFTARDASPLDAAGFAAQTETFSEQQWANLQVEFLPRASAREVDHDLRVIWNALSSEPLERPDFRLEAVQSVLVWREGERATFMMGTEPELRAFAALQSGFTFGEVCMLLAGGHPSDAQAHEAALQAGAWLGRWLNEGLIAAIRA